MNLTKHAKSILTVAAGKCLLEDYKKNKKYLFELWCRGWSHKKLRFFKMNTGQMEEVDIKRRQTAGSRGQGGYDKYALITDARSSQALRSNEVLSGLDGCRLPFATVHPLV